MKDSLLAGVSNGNTMEFASDNSQGAQPRTKEEAGRLQRRVRVLKGLLTHDVTSCIDKIKHFKAKYSPDDDTETTSVQIEYVKRAIDILASLDRAQDRITTIKTNLENQIMLLYETWEEEDDDGLEKALEKLTQDYVNYENKHLKMNSDHHDTIKRCFF